MARIEDLGKSFNVPDDIKHYYKLQPQNPAPAESPNADAGATMDVDQPAPSAQTSAPAQQNEQPSSDSADLFGRSHDNLVISYIDVFGKVQPCSRMFEGDCSRFAQFLEGFFQHVPHCRDFVADADGLDRLARLTSLPCLPYDFANSVASDSLVQVIRTMAEAATSETLTFLVKIVQESLGECKDFWETMDEQPKLLPLVEFSGEYACYRCRPVLTPAQLARKSRRPTNASAV